MALDASWGSFTDEGMKAPGVDLTTATTSVRNAQLQTKTDEVQLLLGWPCHPDADRSWQLATRQASLLRVEQTQPRMQLSGERQPTCSEQATCLPADLVLSQADCLWDAEPTGGKLKVDDQTAL